VAYPFLALALASADLVLIVVMLFETRLLLPAERGTVAGQLLPFAIVLATVALALSDRLLHSAERVEIPRRIGVWAVAIAAAGLLALAIPLLWIMICILMAALGLR
jgi:hypothetical protein